MIGRNGERGSGISALAARHDDDDDYSIIPQNIFGKKIIKGGNFTVGNFYEK